jgi:hypothetical protein
MREGKGRFRGRCPVYSLSAPCGAGAGVAAPFDPTSRRPAHQASRFARPDDGDQQTMHSTPDRPKRSYTLPERPWLPTWQRLATFTRKSAAEGDEAGRGRPPDLGARLGAFTSKAGMSFSFMGIMLAAPRSIKDSDCGLAAADRAGLVEASLAGAVRTGGAATLASPRLMVMGKSSVAWWLRILRNKAVKLLITRGCVRIRTDPTQSRRCRWTIEDYRFAGRGDGSFPNRL